MAKPHPGPAVADSVPWFDGITEYDDLHDETYLRLLDADEKGMSKDEMARRILGIDPATEPERARKAVDSHLERAVWMTRVGYRYLLARRHQDPQRRLAEDLDSCDPSASAAPRPTINPGADALQRPATIAP